MSIISKMSSLILFAFLISSCATNRIKYIQAADHLSKIKSGQFKRQDPTCTLPKSQHSIHKNKAIQSMQSNNRQSAKFTFFMAWKKKNNSSSFKNSSKHDKHSEELISGLGKSTNSHVVLNYVKKEVLFLQKVTESESINQDLSEIFHLPGSFQLINESKDLYGNNRPSSDDILHRVTQTYNTHLFTLASLEQEDQENIIIKKIPNNSIESIPQPVKHDYLQRRPFQKSENSVYLMALLAGCLSLIGLKNTPNFSRNLSYWATMNPWKTRFIITGIHILMGTAGIILGEKLADSGTHFTNLSKNLSLAIFLTSALLYPVRKSPIELFKHTYFRQKTHDLALFLTGFMLMVNVGNHYSKLTPSFANMIDTKNYKQQHEYVSVNKIQAPNQLVFYQNAIQSQDESSVPQRKELSIELKILLTILAIAAACGLGYGLLLLSCSIACSGSEGLAIVVSIGGGILIIGLLIWALRSIFTPKYKRITKSYKI